MCATCDEREDPKVPDSWFGLDLQAWVSAAIHRPHSVDMTYAVIPSSGGKYTGIPMRDLAREIYRQVLPLYGR